MKKTNTMIALFLALAMILTIAPLSYAQEADNKNNINVNAEATVHLPFTRADIDNGFANYTEAKVSYTAITPFSNSDVQLAQVIGQVYDCETNAPVYGATVTFVELNISVVTDFDGRFEINGIPEGTYNLSIVASGYSYATYNNMPAHASSGIEIYSLSISRHDITAKDYTIDVNKYDHIDHDEVNDENITHDDESIDFEIFHDNIVEPSFPDKGSNNSFQEIMPLLINPIYSLKAFTVKYGDDIISFGTNMNDYLYFVVANEMAVAGLTDTQALEAYKAQAVAARSYADYKARVGTGHQSSGYTLCATTCCQAYNPYYTNSNTIAAVDATTNQTLFNDKENTRVNSEYHGTCRGTTSFNGKTMTCSTHSQTVYYGHGRGMCQNGAATKAKSGQTYSTILAFYYPGVELITAYNPPVEGINAGETKRINNYDGTIEFVIYVPKTASYTIETSQASSTAYDTVMELYSVTRTSAYDFTETYITSNDDIGGGNLFSRISRSLNAGEYKVKVRKYGNGIFSAMLSASCNSANISVKVGSSDKPSYHVVGSVQEVLKFVPTTTKSYTISTSLLGTSADTYLKLLNSSGTLLAENDDYSGLYSQVQYSLTAGHTYYIVVTTYTYGKSSLPYNGNNFKCCLKIV